jgi:hypothetical protein
MTKTLRERNVAPLAPLFEIYVDDDRYTVPSLYISMAVDEDEAKAEAEYLWGNSPHHLGVELRRNGESVFRLGSFAAAALSRPCRAQAQPGHAG